jgi:hypothetical protein
LDHMFPARWCNWPYSEIIHGGPSGNISGAHFLRLGELPCPEYSPVIISFGGTSKRKSTPLDHGSPMTSRSQFWSKFQRFQKTWRGHHWETCRQSCKSVYAMMGNKLAMCSSKWNKERRNDTYVCRIKWHIMFIYIVTIIKNLNKI